MDLIRKILNPAQKTGGTNPPRGDLLVKDLTREQRDRLVEAIRNGLITIFLAKYQISISSKHNPS